MPRATCQRCQRPQSYCYCRHLKSVPTGIGIIILQHPSETRHALNTARIAYLGLNNCKLLIGEDFSHHRVLHERLEKQDACLLFPTKDASLASTLFKSTPAPRYAIVIDGTWRKARKILHCNPALQALPAITLAPATPSNYRIRKAPSAQSLSTVEAIVNLLRQAENSATAYQGLLDAFTLLVDNQIHSMGVERYQQNYRQPPPVLVEN